MGAGVVLTALLLVLDRHKAVVARYASSHNCRCLARVLILKEAGMTMLGLAGFSGMPAIAPAMIAQLADSLFTAAALFLPRLFVREIRREDYEIRAASGRPNILVAGTDHHAVALARHLENAGRHNVLGFWSGDPAQADMIIGDLTVYSTSSSAELDALQWCLGGIDAIYFPGGYPQSVRVRRDRKLSESPSS